MKKLILTAFIVCFAFGAQAQSVDFGIKVGANFANISNASHLKNRTGLVAGAFVGLGFNKWAIQPELLYSQEGADPDHSEIAGFDLDYINVPVMVKYYLIGNLLNVQVGPQFGFVVSDDLPEGEDKKGFDFDGAAGLGLDLPFGLRIAARYNFGITKVTENAKGRNNVFSVALGYSFF